MREFYVYGFKSRDGYNKKACVLTTTKSAERKAR